MRHGQFGGSKTEEEEKLLSVQDYLRYELKIDDLQIMETEQIFLSFRDNPKQVYVTIKDESSLTSFHNL